MSACQGWALPPGSAERALRLDLTASGATRVSNSLKFKEK
jgi:hypothetical protein